MKRRRTVGAIALVAAIAAVGAAPLARSSNDEPTIAPAPLAEPERTLASVGRLDARLSRTVNGVQFTFAVPPRTDGGWTPAPITVTGTRSRPGLLGITKSIVGPQGAEAIIFWTSFPDGDRANPCADTLRPLATALGSAVATVPGTKLVAGPSNVTIGGYPAKHIVLTVQSDVGCNPGYFYSWPSKCWGPCWVKTGVDDTIRVWIVAVAGSRLFIEAETTPQADRALKREIEQIVKSIRFP